MKKPAEKKCRQCAMMIAEEAKICPHCRTKQGMTISAGLSVVIIIILSFVALVNLGTDDKPTELTQEQILRIAYSKAEDHVKAVLKAPATATFPYYAPESVEKVHEDNRGAIYEVTSYVDSENSFGANIRTHYKCTLVRSESSHAWILAGLETW